MKTKNPKLKKMFTLCREIDKRDCSPIYLDCGAIFKTLKKAKDYLLECEHPETLVILPVYRLEY